MTNPKSGRSADEHTPLINGESASSAQASNGNHIQHSPRSGVMTFFFDHKHTPGNDSNSTLVRSAAYTWHVTKVTLLSSE
jgi:Ca2+:H+ antiporter